MWKKILIGLKALGFLVLLATLSVFVQIWSHMQIGEGIANSTIKFENIIDEEVGSVLFAGDSTVFGTGASEPRFSTSGLFASDYPMYEVRNLSKNGMKLGEFADMLDSDDGRYDLVVMQIGANDVLRLHEFQNIENDAIRAVEAAKRKSDKIIWLAVGNVGATRFFPWPVSNFYDYWSRKARDVFLRTAQKEGVYYIDLYKKKGDEEFNPTGEDIYARDGLHLNDYGYSLWYKEIKRVVEEKGLIE